MDATGDRLRRPLRKREVGAGGKTTNNEGFVVSFFLVKSLQACRKPGKVNRKKKDCPGPAGAELVLVPIRRRPTFGMNVIREIQRLNEAELELGIHGKEKGQY